MGCDYYIIKVLEVYYMTKQPDNVNMDIIEIERQRGYIYDSYDSDEEDRIEKHLVVTYEPKVLYESNAWKSEYIQTKYESMIRNMNTVSRIVKTEMRERRY